MSNKVLIISNVNELVRIKPERVVYVESDRNYSTMVLHDKTELVFTMNLAHCQQLIEKQLGKEAETFIRIGKQLIVNRDDNPNCIMQDAKGHADFSKKENFCETCKKNVNI